MRLARFTRARFRKQTLVLKPVPLRGWVDLGDASKAQSLSVAGCRIHVFFSGRAHPERHFCRCDASVAGMGGEKGAGHSHVHKGLVIETS